ncbi:MAG: hypothetical protein ACREP8_13520, partial [Candidatus Binatia bacterium]
MAQPVVAGARRLDDKIRTGVSLLVGALLCAQAVAQERGLTLRLGGAIAWDENVFRIPESSPDPQLSRGIGGRSDRITTAYAGLGLNLTYAQQALLLDIRRTATRHDKFTFLDRETLDYDGLWRWHLTPRISGSLTASRVEGLVNFEDAQGAQRIVRTTTTRGATLDGWLFGGWHLLAGASETRTANSQQFLAQPDSRQSGGELGLRYVAPSRSSISVIGRSQRGTVASQTVDLASFTDSSFSASEYELSAAWVASARSSLSGRLTRIERRYEQVPQRDFSGTAGELRYTWIPTGKLSVSASATRAVAPFVVGLDASYRVDDALALAPTWKVSEKISLRLTALHRESDFRGSV